MGGRSNKHSLESIEGTFSIITFANATRVGIKVDGKGVEFDELA